MGGGIMTVLSSGCSRWLQPGTYLRYFERTHSSQLSTALLMLPRLLSERSERLRTLDVHISRRRKGLVKIIFPLYLANSDRFR